ncbi:MAG: hypothetical protein ACRC5T_06885, partial [Cetobacterium sp.]
MEDLRQEEIVETVVEAGEVLTQAEITHTAIVNFIDHVERITGFTIDNKQARLIMEGAITIPMRTIFDISEEHEIDMENIGVNLPFGKVYFSQSEAFTGKPGEAKVKLLDAEGNPILKSRVKIKFSKSVVDESLYLTGWEQEGLNETVEDRLAKEEDKIS